MTEHDLVALALTQHGLVTTRQAGDLGVGRGAVNHAVAIGRWRRPATGVLLIGAAPATPHQRILAAVLSIGDAWASHTSAARLWGWEVRHSRVEVVIRRSRELKRRSVQVHRSARLGPGDVDLAAGIPVTSPARTLVDLSGRLAADDLADCLDLALRRRQVDLETVAAMVAATQATYGRRPQVLGTLLEMRRVAGPTESALESRVLRVLAAAGLPLPVCQHRVVVGGKKYRLDMGWIERRVFSEADGFEYHGSRQAFDADRRRDNALVADGWIGVHLTSAFSDDEIAEAVRSVLALAERPTG